MIKRRFQCIHIDATPEASYRLVADVATWPSFMPAVKRAARISGDHREETVEIEAQAGERTLVWRSKRVLNAAALTIVFDRSEPEPPFVSMNGCWTFIRTPGGSKIVIEHAYELMDPNDSDRIEAIIASNVTKDLDGLKARVEGSAKHQATVIVTGGNRGIGLAIATAFAAADYNIVLGARDLERLETAVRKLSAINTAISVGARHLDVAKDSSVQSFFDWAWDRPDRPSILINNAGIGGGGRTTALDDRLWYEIMDTNLHGVYRCTVAFLQRMEADAQSWGRIINVASTGGKQGVAFGAAYSASKHAVVGFTKALGLEYAKSGITINAVCPGFVETDLAIGARQRYAAVNGVTPEAMKDRIEARVPLGRYVEPNEVAEAVMYFACRRADAVTAQTLNVCGGLGNY